MYTAKQKELIENVRTALNCGGFCDPYCCGCTLQRKRIIQYTARLLSAGCISKDIIEEANKTIHK